MKGIQILCYNPWSRTVRENSRNYGSSAFKIINLEVLKGVLVRGDESLDLRVAVRTVRGKVSKIDHW